MNIPDLIPKEQPQIFPRQNPIIINTLPLSDITPRMSEISTPRIFQFQTGFENPSNIINQIKREKQQGTDQISVKGEEQKIDNRMFNSNNKSVRYINQEQSEYYNSIRQKKLRYLNLNPKQTVNQTKVLNQQQQNPLQKQQKQQQQLHYQIENNIRKSQIHYKQSYQGEHLLHPLKYLTFTRCQPKYTKYQNIKQWRKSQEGDCTGTGLNLNNKFVKFNKTINLKYLNLRLNTAIELKGNSSFKIILHSKDLDGEIETVQLQFQKDQTFKDSQIYLTVLIINPNNPSKFLLKKKSQLPMKKTPQILNALEYEDKINLTISLKDEGMGSIIVETSCAGNKMNKNIIKGLIPQYFDFYIYMVGIGNSVILNRLEIQVQEHQEMNSSCKMCSFFR